MTEENIVKISELEPVDTLYDGCCMPLVQYGETKKIEYATLKQKLNEDLDFVKNTDDLEERINTLEDNEESQNQAIRDLRTGYSGKADKTELNKTNDYVEKLIGAVPKKTTTGTTSLQYNSKAFDLFGGEYGGNTEQDSTTGKNLLNFDNLLTTWNYRYTNENGVYTISNPTSSFYGTPIKLTNLEVGKTYTLSVEKTSQTTTNLRLGILQNNTLLGNAYSSGDGKNSVTFTVESGYTYKIRGDYTNLGSNFIFTRPQLEEGSTPTSYEPYTGGQPAPNPDYPEEIETINSVSIKRTNEDGTIEETTPINLQNNELCKLSNGVKDELIIENGKVKIIKRVGKVVFDGSEGWAREVTYSDKLVCKSPDIIDILKSNTNPLLSNYFLNDDSVYGNNHKAGIYVSTNGFIRIAILTSTIGGDTLTDVKNWLSTHNTEVYYELATPTTIDLGNVDIETLDGENNVSLIATLEPSSMSETYIMDLEKELEELRGDE